MTFKTTRHGVYEGSEKNIMFSVLQLIMGLTKDINIKKCIPANKMNGEECDAQYGRPSKALRMRGI